MVVYRHPAADWPQGHEQGYAALGAVVIVGYVAIEPGGDAAPLMVRYARNGVCRGYRLARAGRGS